MFINGLPRSKLQRWKRGEQDTKMILAGKLAERGVKKKKKTSGNSRLLKKTEYMWRLDMALKIW